MSREDNALNFLQEELAKKVEKTVWSFEEYLEMAKADPRRILRNIFQLFHDMVEDHVSAEESEHPDDPQSIGFIRFDCSKLFVKGSDRPFFADTPFANRFVRQADSLRQGFQQNRMYVYDGPSGCGKSTFLNNILRSFEAYTASDAGRSFEVIWELDEFDENESTDSQSTQAASGKFLVPCPSHDYPILMIPKAYRADFMDKLLPDNEDEQKEIKRRIFQDKEYAWIFQGDACTICKSIFGALMEKFGSLDKVLGMVKVRASRFNRRTGQGISVYNPGDKLFRGAANGRTSAAYFTNKQIQDKLDELLGINAVRYMYSPLAKTNNGIYVLMDVKLHNKERLRELHNVISEGVHKVGDIEESINSLFFALMNPEDKQVIEEENMSSFQGRIQYSRVSYVLEPRTEANIYRSIFGNSIDEKFLPRVLENFARAIISSRMNEHCPPQEEWISEMSKYGLYCDENGLLLRMELYGSNIPDWLDEEDRKTFTAPVRRAIIAEGQEEGDKGFSGRASIALFSDFFSRYGGKESLINMQDVVKFFKHEIGRDRRDQNIPQNFLGSLIDSYDHAVLSEVKEAAYFFNTEQVSKNILNYLCATSYDIGDTVRCIHTGEKFEVTSEFMVRMANNLTGREMNTENAMRYATSIQKKYIGILASKGAVVRQTDLYKELYAAYTRRLKDSALDALVGSKNFREAIKSYGTEEFEVFDPKLKAQVSRIISGLVSGAGYSEQGAKEVCLYVLDNNLVNKFSETSKKQDKKDYNKMYPS